MAEETLIVEVDVPADEVELAADALWSAGPSAVSETELTDGHVRLRADVPDPSVLDARWGWRLVAVDADADLDRWRAFAQPVRVGRIVVQPPWVAAATVGRGDVTITIDPGRAFGSGSHPATQLALAAIERYLAPSGAVLDVGCGSGVLAVAAAVLGAGTVVAIDVDPTAVAATQANAVANDVASRVAASATALSQVEGTFDLVVANIGVRVLTDAAAELEAHVAPAGRLVLSGLLDAQADAVVARCAGCDEEHRLVQDGWSAPVLRRRAG